MAKPEERQREGHRTRLRPFVGKVGGPGAPTGSHGSNGKRRIVASMCQSSHRKAIHEVKHYVRRGRSHRWRNIGIVGGGERHHGRKWGFVRRGRRIHLLLELFEFLVDRFGTLPCLDKSGTL